MQSTISLIRSFLKIGKMKDPVVTGLLGGLIGTFFMEISNFLIFMAGKTETLYGYIAGGLVVSPYRTKQRKNFILGELIHFTIGALWGVLVLYTLKKTSKNHHLIKGGMIAMITLFSIIVGQKARWLKKFRFTKTYYSAIWNHIVYGLVTSQAIISIADPKMFENNPTEKNANRV